MLVLRTSSLLLLASSIYVLSYGSRDLGLALIVAGALLLALSEGTIRKALLACYPIEIEPSGIRLYVLRPFRFKGAMMQIPRSSVQRLIVMWSPEPGKKILSLALQTEGGRLSLGSRKTSQLAGVYENLITEWALPVHNTFPYFMGA